jgi:hypothetical protein
MGADASLVSHAALSANPKWCLDVHGDRLIVSAGADEVYVVDEAPAQALPQLLEAYQANRCAELLDDAVCGAAIRQLRRLGALVPAQATAATVKQRASIRWLGQPWPQLVSALVAQGWDIVEDSADVVLVLLVRTNASWTNALTLYQQQPISKVHVLIDLAYHHTVCIGPLVVPGQTACVACLGHRLMHRWGDLTPPPEPATLHRTVGIAAMLAEATQLSSGLVERSVALDISQLKLQSSVVFPAPGCPVCHAYEAKFIGDTSGHDGKLPLPWI